MEATIAKRNFIRLTRSYTVATIFVVLAAGVFCFLQYQKLIAANEAIVLEQSAKTQIGEEKEKAVNLYKGLRDGFSTEYLGLKDGLIAVFPDKEDYTTLTQRLDDYMSANNTKDNPIFMSDLRFSEPRYEKNKDYGVLPFSITLNTSKQNFTKFLSYIETSGGLTDKVRLMDVNSVSINVNEGRTSTASQVEMLNVTLSLNAYFIAPAKTTEVKK